MNYIEYFKPEDINQYSGLKEELFHQKMDSVITNEEQLNKITIAAVSDIVKNDDYQFNEEIIEAIDKQQREQIAELSNFVAKILAKEPEQKRDSIIEKELKSAERIVKATLAELDGSE